MRRLGAGSLAAALAVVIGAGLAAAPSRAQEPGIEELAAQDSQSSKAQTPGQDPQPAQSPGHDNQPPGPNAQNPQQPDSPTPAPAAAAQTPLPKAAQAPACPGNPDAIGTSRVIAIDPSEYSRLGRLQYPDTLPLADKEVVLTFDDGPLPPYSSQILDTLAAQCVKVNYFLVGTMARAYPAVARRMYEEGHTIGTHSDTHPMRFGSLPLDRMRREIDGGIADVSAALGDSKYLAPFFRIPGFARSDTAESELAARSLIVFSTDTVADDWHRHITPNQIISLAMRRLEARGKGMLLLHDIHPTTAAALPGLLKALKDNGFHIVQVVPSASWLIAAASKPAARVLASAVPGELMIGSGGDGSAAAPAWPASTDSLARDETALPVPDPSTFEPESGVAAVSGSVQWPSEPTLKPDSVADRPVASEKNTARKGEARSGRRHVADKSPDQDRRRAEREHARRHERTRAGSDRHRADLGSGIKAFAAMFTPPATTPAY